jgi:hypothetical protein
MTARRCRQPPEMAGMIETSEPSATVVSTPSRSRMLSASTNRLTWILVRPASSRTLRSSAGMRGCQRIENRTDRHRRRVDNNDHSAGAGGEVAQLSRKAHSDVHGGQ